ALPRRVGSPVRREEALGRGDRRPALRQLCRLDERRLRDLAHLVPGRQHPLRLHRGRAAGRAAARGADARRGFAAPAGRPARGSEWPRRAVADRSAAGHRLVTAGAGELIRLTAREAVARLKRRALTPLDLVEAAAARIEAADGDVTAVLRGGFVRAGDYAKRLMEGQGRGREDHAGWL